MSLNPKDDLHWQATAEDADWTAQSPHTAEKQQQLANPQVETVKQQRKKRKPRGLVAYNEDDEDDEDEEVTESDEETESEKDHQSERSTTEGEEKATPPKATEVSFTEPIEQDESRLKSQISNSHDLSESLSVQLGQFDKSSTVTFEVEGECDPDVERRVVEAHAKLLNERRAGNSRCFWNDTIQSLKAFRNPSIYEKLVEFIDIDEKGSNFDPLCAVYNVAVFGRESFYDELARAQHEEMERITAHQKAAQRAKVEFVSKRTNAAAGANQSSASGAVQLASANLNSGGSSSNLATSAEPQPKRRSKWDAPAGSAQSVNSASKPSAAPPTSVSK